MPLLPKVIDSYGFMIKQYIISAPSSMAAPFNIMIYHLPELPTKFNTSLAEYYARCQYYGRLHKFKANYYVDNITIWNVAPAQGKLLRVAVCGDKQRTFKRASRLIANLAKAFSIPQECIHQRFIQDDFAGLLAAAMQKVEVPHIEFSHQEKIQESAVKSRGPAQVICETQINGEWSKPILGTPMQNLRLTSPLKNLYFRIYQAGAWSSWSQTEINTIDYNPIKGFQYELQSSDYELQFRVHFLNSNWTPWKSKCLSIPYNKTIDSIEFKLIKKEGE